MISDARLMELENTIDNLRRQNRQERAQWKQIRFENRALNKVVRAARRVVAAPGVLGQVTLLSAAVERYDARYQSLTPQGGTDDRTPCSDRL